MPGPVLAGCWGYSGEKGRSGPILMCLEGKRPPWSLNDEPELVREEQVVRQGGGLQTEERHVQRSRGRRN